MAGTGGRRMKTDPKVKAAAAESIAKAIRGDLAMTQDRAALAAGIHPRTYWKWMHGHQPDDLDFQFVVLPAIHEQAARNHEAANVSVEHTDGKLINWRKWELERRYRHIYGDLAQVSQVEVSGPGGGPIETSTMSTGDIEKRLAELAAKAKLPACDDDGGDDE